MRQAWPTSPGAASLAAAAVLAACAAAPTPEPVAVGHASRRSDPLPWIPPPVISTPESGHTVGLVASSGGSPSGVVAVSLAFVRAILDEDLEGLMDFLAAELAVGTSGRTVPNRMLREHFQRQFALLDFGQFTLEEVVYRDRIEVVRFEDEESGARAGGTLREGDVLVRLNMLVTRRNRRRYFDDVMELWFRHEAGRWRVVAWGR